MKQFFVMLFILSTFSFHPELKANIDQDFNQNNLCVQVLVADSRKIARLLEVKPASISEGVGIKKFDSLLKNRWILKTLEKLIGVNVFNREVYIPTLESLAENYDEVYKKSQSSSLYDLSQITEEQLALRLFIEALYLKMEIETNQNDPERHLEDLVEMVPPKDGPTIAIANHPYGIIEGLIFSRALLQRRPDVKFIANSMVSKVMPPMSALSFSVDVVTRKNNGVVELAIDHVNRGGLLAIFPDPLVPIKKPFYSGRNAKQDMDFKTGVARIAVKTDAHIVMAHIGGGPQNSIWFHLGGSIHLVFKLMRHLPEFIRNQGIKTFTLVLASGPSSKELIQESLDEGVELESLSSGEMKSLIKRMTEVLRDYYLAIFPDL
jgi:hypothetical protein